MKKLLARLNDETTSLQFFVPGGNSDQKMVGVVLIAIRGVCLVLFLISIEMDGWLVLLSLYATELSHFQIGDHSFLSDILEAS